MRIFVIAGAAIAVVCVAAVQVANSRLDQTRVRAAEANTAAPQSADDRRIVSDNVVAYATANQEIATARQKARETLPRFVDLLNSGMKATFTVKFPLTQNGKIEHIWLQVAGLKDGAFIGMLANTPVNGTKYKLGQAMTVASKDVEDWMVRTSDQIYGGYTARYQIKDLPKAQAEKLASMFRD